MQSFISPRRINGGIGLAFLKRFGVTIRIGLAVLILGSAGCKQPQPPEYFGFRDLQIGAATGAQTTVSTIVKLYNPNPFGLELKRAEVNVSINGHHAGHSLLDSTIRIPERDTFYVPIAMQVDLQAIMRNALQSLLGGEATVTLDGRVRIRRGMLTFNRPFHYDGKEDLNALLQQGF
ncbi:MAG TPA: LEA type 2 family protein [Puia sp.]|nr:LEA type 2 family protein [Puia sp.]